MVFWIDVVQHLKKPMDSWIMMMRETGAISLRKFRDENGPALSSVSHCVYYDLANGIEVFDGASS